jgi:peptidoglycan/LPS O-acetylase OafA/YrhL
MNSSSSDTHSAIQRSHAPDVAHLQALDTLRGLAACGVFVGHFTRQFYSSHQSETWWLLLDRLGVIGVAVFFVLSGFLIHSGGIKEMRRGGGQINWPAYARRRFFRIYPAYLAALLLYGLLARYLPSDNTSPASVVDVLSHVLLLSNFVPGQMHSINGVLWSVVIECHFYMLYPAVVWLGKRWPAGRVFVSTLVLGLAFFLVSTLLTRAGEVRALWQQAAPAMFWKWMLGAMLAEMWLNGRFTLLRRVLTHWWVLLPVLGLLYAGTFFKHGALELSHHRFVLPVLCAALVGVFVFSPLSRWRSRLGVWLGEVSYSIYLWHPLAIALALAMWPGMGVVTLLATLALTLAMAAFSHRWIEKPGMAWGKKLGTPAPNSKRVVAAAHKP